jgi:hypothetical protein
VSGDSTTRSVAEVGSSQPAKASAVSATALLPSRSTTSLAATQTVVAPASTALLRVQAIVVGVLLILTGLAATRLWLIIGLARTVRIEGASMAPAWVGGHFRVTCDDCGLVFRCDAEHAPANGVATCPNCGFKDVPLRDKNLVPGQQVVVDRWPLLVRAPRRGDVVAATDPQQPGELVIKRVAGLPGERLAIRGGDLWANDRLVRKSLRELSAVRVLVHDSRHVPHHTVGLPDRWQSKQPGTLWYRAPGGYRFEPPVPPAEAAVPPPAGDFDWLVYHHWRMYHAHSRTKLAEVFDNDSYNQVEQRNQNAVPDVLLTCRMRMGRTGRLALAATDGGQRFEVVIDPATGGVELRADGQVVASEELGSVWSSRRGVRVEFGLCDQQVLLSVASREVFRHAYTRPDGPRSETLHPLAIGVEGLPLDVTDLVVWRDLYYLHPSGTANPWQADAPLPPQSFALLGDNTSISTDSRAWTSGVPVGDILGAVYQPFWAPQDSPISH